MAYGGAKLLDLATGLDRGEVVDLPDPERFEIIGGKIARKAASG